MRNSNIRSWCFLFGIAAIATFPYFWLQLAFDFSAGTVGIVWRPERGVTFFKDLLPTLLVTLTIAFGIYWARRWNAERLQRKASGLGDLTDAPSSTEPSIQKKQSILTPRVWLGLAILASAAWWLDAKHLGQLFFAGLYMLQALGLNITIGMTGLLVLGCAAFFTFGAYVFALGAVTFPWLSWWIALPIAFCLTGLVGWLVGLPCLRLRGDYLAIVTLGFSEGFRELLRNLKITNGDIGLIISPAVQIQSFLGLSRIQAAYLIGLVAVTLAVVLIYRLCQSPIGRAWIAIREDETAAASMGIPVVRLKLLAFAASAAIAGAAGVLYAAYSGFINPAAASFEQSILILAMIIVGGLGSIPGALLGAGLLFFIPEILRDHFPALMDYRLFLFGIILVVMVRIRSKAVLQDKNRGTPPTDSQANNSSSTTARVSA